MAGLGFRDRVDVSDPVQAGRVVRALSEQLPGIDDGDAFCAMFGRFADAKVVLLGEARHGT